MPSPTEIVFLSSSSFLFPHFPPPSSCSTFLPHLFSVTPCCSLKITPTHRSQPTHRSFCSAMLLLPLIVCEHQQPTSHPPVLPLCELNGELDRTNSQKYRELVRKYQFAVLRGVKRILSAKQLEESKVLNDQQQKNFIDEIQKEQKEQLHAKIVQLEKQLDVKQKLELEIQQLKGSLSVLKQIQDDKDAEVLMKEDALQKELEEKELSLQDLDALNQVLIIKERERNDELQEARKELINGIKDRSTTHAKIGVKRMGD